MIIYPRYLATLRQAKLEGGVKLDQLSNTSEDSLWLEAIGKMSAWVERLCGCSFEPVIVTTRRNINDNTITDNGLTLYLRARLLEAIEVKLGTGDVVEEEDYILLPYGGRLPYTEIKLNEDSGLSWLLTTTTLKAAIEITGVWGHRENYAEAWEEVATLDDDATANATTLTLDATTSVNVGALLKIGDEYLRVIEVTDGTSLEVRRGKNGTTRAAHLTGVTIYQWTPEPIVSDAVGRGVGWIKRRYGTFESVNWNSNTGISTVIKSSLPEDVYTRVMSLAANNYIPQRRFSKI